MNTVVNWKETFKYQFARVDKHRGKNKPKRNNDGWGLTRLLRIVKDKLEKFRMKFFKVHKPLRSSFNLEQVWSLKTELRVLKFIVT